MENGLVIDIAIEDTATPMTPVIPFSQYRVGTPYALFVSALTAFSLYMTQEARLSAS
jgi:hypothetical protein